MPPFPSPLQASKKLELGVRRCDPTLIMAAVSAGADPNRTCRYGVLPLHNAVECGDIELIVLLVRAGADINLKVQCVWVFMRVLLGFVGQKRT